MTESTVKWDLSNEEEFSPKFDQKEQETVGYFVVSIAPSDQQ